MFHARWESSEACSRYAMWTIKNIISSLWNLMPVYFSFLLPDNVLFSWYHNCPLFVQVSWLVAWLLKSQMVHLMFMKYGSLHTSSIGIFFLHQSNYPRFICSWLPMHEKGAVGRVVMGWPCCQFISNSEVIHGGRVLVMVVETVWSEENLYPHFKLYFSAYTGLGFSWSIVFSSR